MLGLLTALVLGLLIGIAYMIACKKDGYNKNFIIGLVLLPAIVSVVILLIGSNVARAFSMAGAFALVRFRSAPGNAKDIAVVFFTMAAGLACGLGYVAFAAIFAVVIIVGLLRIAVRMRTRKIGEQLVAAFVILSFLLSMFIYISVDDVQARWVMAGVAPMVLFLVLLERLPALKQYVLLTVCYGMIAMLGAHEYKLIYTSDQNEELREVYNLLMDSDYTFGYATFRAGNLMTELTNGKVDMRIVQAYAPNHKLKNRHWLTPIEFEYHEGTFPLILDKERTEGTFDPQDDWKLILDTEAYWVYEIPDQRAFQEYLDKVEL